MRSDCDTAPIRNEAELDELLTRPSERLLAFIQTLRSPLVVLGAGGKMGPTLAAMAKRAAVEAGVDLEVLAASRFSVSGSRERLAAHGVKTIECDLLDEQAVARLPAAENVIYLAGLKFGTAKDPARTWAINTLAPANVAKRYKDSRIVALSTGNVYPPSSSDRGGSIETDPLTPQGEYANAAVARERIFQYFSSLNGTPVALIRLFYAVELRYGVLVDLGKKIISGDPIHLANSYFSCIWQGDANEMIIRSLGLATSPASPWNLCRPEIFSVREIAAEMGELFTSAPLFRETDHSTALLGNSRKICQALGEPPTNINLIKRWVVDWMRNGGPDLGKPTHFEVRDGNF